MRRLGEEAGQTSGEYVAVTAVAIVLAIGVAWAGLSSQFTNAISDVASGLLSFITSAFP